MIYDTSLSKKLEKDRLEKLEGERKSQLAIVRQKLGVFFKGLHVKEAYLFGSILQPGNFRSDSDMDIAVGGLNPKNYFQVFGQIENLLGREIDLVELEKCRFADSIEKYGERIL